jgi:hypothetical protein
MRLSLRRSLFAAVLLLLPVSSSVTGQSWQKYVSKDRSYSFHYPAGWKVTENESTVEITNSAADEQLLVVAMPFDAAKTPRQLAEDMIALFRSGMPDLRASDWSAVAGAPDTAVRFRTTYSNKGTKYDGNVIVIKSQGQAMWFSFSAPLAGYDPGRAFGLLQGLVGSIASGAASKAPSGAPSSQPDSRAKAAASVQSPDSRDRNAKAFLFVLEFALGAPLTVGQEKVILAELLEGWKDENAEALRKYDQYPALVQVILKLRQSDLESTRSELEIAVRQWIEDYRGRSPSVAIIENELKRRGRALVPAGEPPLTEMAASAYSELMAYSELLTSHPDADVSQIPEEGIALYRRRVTTQWTQLSRRDRDLIATTPGLWICLRTLLTSGDQTERQNTRSQIRRLTAQADSSSADAGRQAQGQSAAEAMLKHNVLMNIQQQTFNQYMWSRGFNYSPTAGKMW